MAIKMWKPKLPKQLKPPVNPAMDALRLKRGEIKESQVTPEALKLNRITPYQDLEKMAGQRKWYSETGEPEPGTDIEGRKARLVELRKKSRYSLDVLTPQELEEIDTLEKELRKKGITYIGTPPPLRKMR